MLTRMVSVIAVVTMVVITLAVANALARNDRLLREGVSSLRYAPKPFYDNHSRIRVTFTTTGRARPRFKYAVSLIIARSNTSTSDCTSIVTSEASHMVVAPQQILGGRGKTYTVQLRSDYAPDLGYFCRGLAILSVYTTPIGHNNYDTRKTLRRTTFRILPAP